MRTLLAVLILNTAAGATAAVIRYPEQWFTARDSNRDGKISLGEFIDHQTGISDREGKNWSVGSMKQRFQSLDINQDNAIALNELLPQTKKTDSTKSTVPRKNTRAPAKAFSMSAFHDFLGKNGKTFRGKVLAYDVGRNIVTIQNIHNCTRKVSPEIFSEADRIYLRDWCLSKGFNSESCFRISAKRKQFAVDRKRHVHAYYGSENAKTTIERVGYEIRVDNRIATTLEDISIEYCIYYEQVRADRNKQVTDEGVKFGLLHIAKLKPKSSTVLKTDPVTLRKHELSADWFYYSGAENTQKGKMIGIWLRVHLPLSEGRKMTRHYSLPDSLMNNRKWFDHTIPVGANRR